MYIWTNKLSSRSTLYLLPDLSLPSTLQKLCSSLIIICKSIQNLLTVCYLTQISNTCTAVYLNCFDVWSHNLFKTEPGLLSDCSLSVRQMSSWILWLQILVTRRAITQTFSPASKIFWVFVFDFLSKDNHVHFNKLFLKIKA